MTKFKMLMRGAFIMVIGFLAGVLAEYCGISSSAETIPALMITLGCMVTFVGGILTMIASITIIEDDEE